MSNRKLSVHTEHEVLLKMEKAGFDELLAQRMIQSKDNELAKRVVAYIKAGASDVEINVAHITVEPNVSLNCDKTKEGCKNWSDVKEPTGELTLELVEFLEKGENSIGGEVLVRRAKQKNVLLGQRHAEALLENQGTIPQKWRKYYLVFPGSVLQDSTGHRIVPIICWGGGCWYLDFLWLKRIFSSDARLVGSRK